MNLMKSFIYIENFSSRICESPSKHFKKNYIFRSKHFLSQIFLSMLSEANREAFLGKLNDNSPPAAAITILSTIILVCLVLSIFVLPLCGSIGRTKQQQLQQQHAANLKQSSQALQRRSSDQSHYHPYQSDPQTENANDNDPRNKYYHLYQKQKQQQKQQISKKMPKVNNGNLSPSQLPQKIVNNNYNNNNNYNYPKKDDNNNAQYSPVTSGAYVATMHYSAMPASIKTRSLSSIIDDENDGNENQPKMSTDKEHERFQKLQPPQKQQQQPNPDSAKIV